MNITYKHIKSAAELIEGRVLRTPFVPSMKFSELTGADVWLKLENLQHTGAFKVRGALVKLLSLSEAERKAGVIAASAGNHAQGVGYFARQLGIPAIIVMPKNTPFTKISRTEALGAKVVLHGNGFMQARDHALELSNKEGYAFVHPYDDERVIAGQGTVAIEMLEQKPDLDAMIVSIGGGGLISGMGIAAKVMKPEIEVYGVQAALFPSMFDAYHQVVTEYSGDQTIADGIAVKEPSVRTHAIIDRVVDDVFLAGEIEIEQAIQDYLEMQRIIAEGAGAAPLAALMRNKDRFKGKSVGLVVSGGNIDSRMLSSILMRGLAREGRLASLRINIPDMPGVLAIIAKIIGDSGSNIIEVHHQRLFSDVALKQTQIDVAVETIDRKHVQGLVDKLCDAGFDTKVMSTTAVEGER
ncbi:MAG: threonine ammonia-lyase [Rhodospirillales bacterium]|nr:threonine ammonia-lyase [Rhodospirillales bacterium]